MMNQKKSVCLGLFLSLIVLSGCTKSTPPPSEENSDPPMISMEAMVPEEQPAGSFKMAVAAKDGFTSGKPVAVDLELTPADGKATPKLKMKETNFLIVSKDGKDFQRIKPTENKPGKLQLTITFPHDGQYESCLQFTGDDGKNYSCLAPIQVGEGKTGLSKLLADADKTKDVDSFTFKLVDPPEHPSDKFISMPSFRISQDRRPLSNIQPIDGKAGYAVVIKEGEEQFLRTIPVTNQSANKLYQQPIMFHVKITEPGVYRMWSQFKMGDAVHTVDYTFNVTPAAAS